MFTTVKLEDFVPPSHPLRLIRTWVNDALAKMDAKFSAMYEADVKGGRPRIASEKLMRAMLLQVLYSVRLRSLRSSLALGRACFAACRFAGAFGSQRYLPGDQLARPVYQGVGGTD